MLQRAAAVLCAAAASIFAADPTLMRMVDPSSKTVVGMYVDRSVASPFGQFVLNQIQTDDKGIQAFIDLTGFDPTRDLREVIFSSTAGGRNNGVFLATGIFDPWKLTSAVIAHKGTLINYDGIRVLQTSKASGQAWIALIDNQTIAAGSQDQVKAALDRRNNASALDPTLAAKVQDVSSKYDAWMASIAPVGQFDVPIPNPNAQGMLKGDVFQSIQVTDGGVHFGPTVQVYGEAVAKTPQDAQTISGVAHFLVSMLQSNQNNPDVTKLAPLLQNLNLSTAANTFSVSLAIPEQDLESLIKQGNGQSHDRVRQSPKKIVYRQ